MLIIDKETGEILENAIVLDDRQQDRQQQRSKPRGSMITITCAAPGCNGQKEVRLVDYKRGWGRFCNKSCAAKARG